MNKITIDRNIDRKWILEDDQNVRRWIWKVAPNKRKLSQHDEIVNVENIIGFSWKLIVWNEIAGLCVGWKDVAEAIVTYESDHVSFKQKPYTRVQEIDIAILANHKRDTKIEIDCGY